MEASELDHEIAAVPGRMWVDIHYPLRVTPDFARCVVDPSQGLDASLSSATGPSMEESPAGIFQTNQTGEASKQANNEARIFLHKPC